MKKQWLKKGVATAALTVSLATASVAVYAQDATAEPPAATDVTTANPGLGGPGFRGPGPMVGMNIIAQQLGIDPSELFTELKAGKTIAQIAADKGVATDTIVNAVVAAEQTRLTTAVTDGRLTQAQADARLALAKADVEAALDKNFDAQNGPVFGQRQEFGMGANANVMSVVAQSLGIDETELQTELQSGKTISQIAADKNVSTDTIVAAVVAAQKEKLDAAVTAGTLTQTQADTRLAQFQTLAQNLLDQTMTGRGPGMGGQGNGFGGRGQGGQGNGFGGRGHGGQGNGGGAPAPESTATPNA
ncbi:MAG: hypothetical protein ABI690_31710 [Chloroflexota bacterium]